MSVASSGAMAIKMTLLSSRTSNQRQAAEVPGTEETLPKIKFDAKGGKGGHKGVRDRSESSCMAEESEELLEDVTPSSSG